MGDDDDEGIIIAFKGDFRGRVDSVWMEMRRRGWVEGMWRERVGTREERVGLDMEKNVSRLDLGLLLSLDRRSTKKCLVGDDDEDDGELDEVNDSKECECVLVHSPVKRLLPFGADGVRGSPVVIQASRSNSAS
jgi:hypothetical protein